MGATFESGRAEAELHFVPMTMRPDMTGASVAVAGAAPHRTAPHWP
jgi:hypothetical protein